MTTRTFTLLVLSSGLVYGQIQYSATDTDVTLRYAASGARACVVEASESETMRPLVASVDPAVLASSSSDERFAHLRSGDIRTFVLGSRSSALANGVETPLWLKPDTSYYVAVRCGDGAPIRGVVRTEPVGGGASRCTYSLNVTKGYFPSGAAQYTVDVRAPGGCRWQAESNQEWARVLNGASGTGDGRVSFTVDENNGDPRSGALSVAGVTFAVAQEAGPAHTPERCAVGLRGVGVPSAAFAASERLEVGTPPGCFWQARSMAPWLHIASSGAGFGTGELTYRLDPNPGASRSGWILVGDQGYRVDQRGGAPEGCEVTFSVTEAQLPANGGTYDIGVRAPEGCAWRVETNSRWARIAGTASGSGNGAVQVEVDANSGAKGRGAEILSSHGRVSLVQDAPGERAVTICPTITFGVGTTLLAALGGSYTVPVVTLPGCPWSASSSDPFIHVTTPTGTGPGTVSYTIDANATGSSRNGNISVNGVLFAVNQPSILCSYSTDFSSSWYAAAGGTYNINITAGLLCGWTVTSPVAWIQVTAGASGTGNGTATIVVSANTSAGTVRTANISAAGHSYSLNQIGPPVAPPSCPSSPTAYESFYPPDAGNYTMSLQMPSNCNWVAAVVGSWNRVTSANSGSGNSLVQYQLDQNTGTYRQGQISIGNILLTTKQIGSACQYATSFNSSFFPASGGNYTVTVSAPSACSWTASSSSGWVRITSGSSGSGNGSTGIVIDPNSTGAVRTYSITVAGVSVQINQVSSAPVCSVAPVATESWYPGAANSYALGVIAGSGCSWSASTSTPWITITGGSGSGNGNVSFTLAANTTGESRQGSISVSGQTFTVRQAIP